VALVVIQIYTQVEQEAHLLAVTLLGLAVVELVIEVTVLTHLATLEELVEMVEVVAELETTQAQAALVVLA
jgi:hypothetical protein